MVTNGHNGNGRLPFHELATLFPPMSDEEYEGLKADIAMNGVHQPVAVWRGQVIDGLHRYKVCRELGVEAPLRYLGDETDPVAFVLSANMSRRQLTPSQKVIITAQLPRLMNGSNQHHPGSDGTRLGIERLGTQPYTKEQRASLAGVDVSYQDRADAVVDHGDIDVIAKVHLGEISVEGAYHSVRAARNAEAQAEKARQARERAEERVRAEREAEERARAERKAAEERARVAQEVQERARAERQAEERARTEREAAEERARAERQAEESAKREAEERARAEREAAILSAAKDQVAADPETPLPKAVKEQRRREALRTAQEMGDQSPYDNESGDIDLSNAVAVGRHSRVVFADSLDPDNGLPSLPDASVALTFTSPPYWTFAEYGDMGVGYEGSYEGYIDSLQRVFTAVWQKTLPGGRTVVNISNMKSKQEEEGAARIYPIVADLIRVMTGIGFVFFDEIVWHKGNANAGALGGSPLWGSYPYPPTPKILDSTFENILVFSKPGSREVDMGVKEQSRLTMEDWREYTKGVWAIPHDRDPNHPATFPMEVADRIVRLYSFVYDVVVDPFAGTGTAVVSAERNLRAGVGYEIAPMYQAAVQGKAEQWLTVPSK